ncbi:hypothetical protein [uncultured Rhodoblastus sp.]|uniref:hypothetical protein n=1 Tax=uncultured Rhodoblastus sp. TaxID=543037 RepID=UPI0025EB0584|nr:hypothetical protein [uncultured Rhodoblastus sp.]
MTKQKLRFHRHWPTTAVHNFFPENTSNDARTVRAKKSPLKFNESVPLNGGNKQSKNMLIPREANDSPGRVASAPHNRRVIVRRGRFMDLAQRSHCNGARPRR